MSEKYFIQKQTLEGIADVIREATGSTEPISFETESIKTTIRTTIENSGTKLPTLDNPAVADDILEGKQSINGSGNVVTGTFTIDNELSLQDSLIAQIQTTLEGKAVGGDYNTIYINTLTPSNDVGVDGDIWIVKE